LGDEVVLSTKTIIVLGIGIILVIILAFIVFSVSNISLIPPLDINALLGAKASAP
jgi:hypothetical protein